MDQEHEQRRPHEAHGVGDDGQRGTDQLDQSAGQTRPRQLRGGPAALQLRVALDELIPLDDRRQVRLVSDVEEHGQDAVDERHDVELGKR